MSISAAQVKELRERTGAGMMECKRALEAVQGNMEKAIEDMRKSGAAKAAKKASRIAAEGIIVVSVREDKREAIVVEVNCETDFVARNDEFKQFAQAVAHCALRTGVHDVTELLTQKLQEFSSTVDDASKILITKLGENIQIRRLQRVKSQGALTGYSHSGRIGTLVGVIGGDAELGKDLAMHVAASAPQVIRPEEVSAELLSKERIIFEAQIAESGKPADVVAKIVEGKLKKFVNDVTLLGQAFVKDTDITVAELLKRKQAQVDVMVRLAVGEGIEKEEKDFAAEVMAQVKG